MITATQIQKAREALGETQTEFARRLRVDQSTISRWEQEGVSDHLTSIAVESLLSGLAPRRVRAAS